MSYPGQLFPLQLRICLFNQKLWRKPEEGPSFRVETSCSIKFTERRTVLLKRTLSECTRLVSVEPTALVKMLKSMLVCGLLVSCCFLKMVEDNEKTGRSRIFVSSCFIKMVEDGEETARWRIICFIVFLNWSKTMKRQAGGEYLCVILFYQNGRRRWRDTQVENYLIILFSQNGRKRWRDRQVEIFLCRPVLSKWSKKMKRQPGGEFFVSFCFVKMVVDSEETGGWRIICLILFSQNGRGQWRDRQVENWSSPVSTRWKKKSPLHCGSISKKFQVGVCSLTAIYVLWLSVSCECTCTCSQLQPFDRL